MGKRNNRRTGRSQPTATFNRLHQIILARETNQTLLQTTAVLRSTTILRQTITNTPYLYPNHSSLYVNTTFQQQYIQFPHPALFNQQLPTTPFVPSFYHHPNYNTIRPSSATHLFDRDGTPCNVNSDINPHTPISASLPPPPGTYNVSLPSSPSPFIETEVGRILHDYRTTTDSEPHPPRFDPTYPPPSNLHHLPQHSLPSQPPSHHTFHAPPQQQSWSHAD